MVLFVKFSGGMGVSYKGSVDLSALPDELSEAVRSSLSEKSLSKISKAKKNEFATDTVTYEFQYENSSQSFSIDESQASDELLELIDSLRSYLKLEPN